MSSGTSFAASSIAQVDKFLTKINQKSKQLQMQGMTLDDRAILKNSRLNLIWAEPDEKVEGQGQSATTWRRGRARRIYGEIQDADDHMFLAFVLAIPPTECAKTSFNSTIESLLRLESYESYRLNLDPIAQKFFESTAAELGFTGSRRYLSFMQALFPQQQESRQIEFAYSLIPLDDIPAFLETIQRGIYTSIQVKAEKMQGVKTSGCVTVFVPTGQKDGSCNLIIDRKVLMEAIHKFKLSDLKL